MEQRISLITLGVADLDRSRRFYEDLGWRGQEVDETVFFQAGGLGLVLWARYKLANASGAEAGPAVGFGGIVLAHNVASRAEVDALMAEAAAAGAAITAPAADNDLGFYTGTFADPDGNHWEIAYNPSFPLAADGSLTLPDFGAA